MKKTISDFVSTAIQSFSPESFDSLVLIFEKNYLNNESIVVNGVNDGGIDIRIFQNHREIKKCVQVTVNKTIEGKLKSDLLKVNKLISEYNFSTNFDFFCSVRVSEEQIEKYKKFARDNYDINLEIYDCNRLAQLDCKPVIEYVFSLFNDVDVTVEPYQVNNVDKVLYDLLAGGQATQDIKNGILQSIVLLSLYGVESMRISELQKNVESKVNMSIPSFINIVNSLKTTHQIEKVNNDSNIVRLSNDESNSMRAIVVMSTQLEQEFMTSLNAIASKYGILDVQKLLEQLKKLYNSSYQSEIGDFNQVELEDNHNLDQFVTYLKKSIANEDLLSKAVEEIRTLCDNNSFLNRLTVSSSFLDLYKSNRLDYYIDHKNKKIFFDTPTFIYFLCAQFSDQANWDNPYFKSVQSLIKMQQGNDSSIEFCIMADYLGEVAGELKKALQCCWIEKTLMGSYLGETKNTFYNYYSFMKRSESFELSDNISSFEDFVEVLGFDNIDSDSSSFMADTIRRLNELAENSDVLVIPRQFYEEYNHAKELYEKHLGLSNNRKSPTAIQNDVSQVLYLLDYTNFINSSGGYAPDLYFATWDGSLFGFRKKLIEQDKQSKYKYFNIVNPAKLSNRLALAKFKIDSSCISCDIFMYAEAKYDISSKVKSLLDIIAPILGRKEKINGKLIGQLAKLRSQQIECLSEQVTESQHKNLPIEDVLIAINKYATEKSNEQLYAKMADYMNDEANVDSILKSLTDFSEDLMRGVQIKVETFFVPILGNVSNN